MNLNNTAAAAAGAATTADSLWIHIMTIGEEHARPTRVDVRQHIHSINVVKHPMSKAS